MKIKIAGWILGSIAVIGALAFFAEKLLGKLNMVILSPKGVIGIEERDLFITAFSLMLIVVIPVLVLMISFAFFYRAKDSIKNYAPDLEHNHFLEVIWWLIPLGIVAILAVMAWRSSYSLNPYKPLVSDEKPFVIEVVALEWKWLFIYPEEEIASIGEIYFPQNRPIQFNITADAPMNSFWIPELGGQIYAMGGMQTQLHLMANEVGEFNGMSANFSGKGFSEMTFKAKAVTAEQFDKWVGHISQTASFLTVEEYRALKVPTTSHAVTFYRVEDPKLFHKILMQDPSLTIDRLAS
ncbi:MAG: ubiquinol oxidase subunit II [Candidatus Rhabdochlamydia sp.]